MIIWLDGFRKLPRDLSEQSPAGAVITIVCAAVVFALASVEIKYYLQPQSHSQIFASKSHSQETFPLNIDVTFPFVPCDVIGLNIRDALKHSIDD
jgi:hypothetical protein